MSAPLPDHELTAYALNELPQEQRLYVESLLAVSEDCRADVCGIIETALLLEQGFEREGASLPAELTVEQREKLIRFEPRRRYFDVTAALIAAAAALAFAISHPALWHLPGSAQQVARVSTQVSNYVVDAVTPDDGIDFVGQLANWTQLADDPVLKKFFTSEWFSGDHGVQSASLGAAGTWDTMPRGSFDGMP